MAGSTQASASGSASEPEEVPLGLGRRQSDRALVGGRGLAVAAQPLQQISARGVECVVIVQAQPVDQSECSRGTLQFTDCDGAIECDDRRGGNCKQSVIQSHDLGPVG